MLKAAYLKSEEGLMFEGCTKSAFADALIVSFVERLQTAVT